MLREEELAEQLPRAPLRLVAAQPASLAALRLVPVRHRLAHEGEHPLLAVVHLQAFLRVVPVHHLAAATGTGRMRRRGASTRWTHTPCGQQPCGSTATSRLVSGHPG